VTRVLRYSVICARGHDRRTVEVEANTRAGVADAAKRQAAREFEWPFDEITIIEGKRLASDGAEETAKFDR
jgi:hypothetical protein